MADLTDNPRLRKLLGWAAVFGSAFFFYFSTVIVRLASREVDIDVAYYTFCRFVLGFLLVAGVMLYRRQPVRPVNYHFLLGRMFSNTLAVYCFYQAALLGSVAEANILNMTYPLFVAFVSWFIFKAQRDLYNVGFVLLACFGVWLILSPERGAGFAPENIWGLVSGVSAAAAIIYLDLARREHDSNTILFFLFGPGALLMGFLFYDSLFWPGPEEFFYLLVCSVTGIGGQYLITYGFRFVTAVEGSVISSTRILLAALLGPILIGEPSLGIIGWCGAFLIFAANVGLALRKI